MKKKISICIEEDTLKVIEQELTKNIFRSRSHVIEYAVNNQIKEGLNYAN
jgi:metal-responsive CopG/Arc/MetJ family transcriptional regulator